MKFDMNRTATAVSVRVVAATGIGATTEQCRVTQSGFPMANYTLRRPRSSQRRRDSIIKLSPRDIRPDQEGETKRDLNA